MTLPNLFLLEDEPGQQLLISNALRDVAVITTASSVHQAKQILDENGPFDFFILDIMLEDGDGYEFLAHLKTRAIYHETPVMFLTSKAEVSSKVLGFSLGADDYLVKPCDPVELRVRIESKLKKASRQKEQLESFVQGDLTFHLEKQSVNAKEENDTVELSLTPLEFKLLYYLARHKDQVLSREKILSDVWGQQTHVMDRSVDTYVAALRRKLGPRSRYIKSVHGVGYRFVIEAAKQKAS